MCDHRSALPGFYMIALLGCTMLILLGGSSSGQEATIRAEFGSVTVRAMNLDREPVSWRTPVSVVEARGAKQVDSRRTELHSGECSFVLRPDRYVVSIGDPVIARHEVTVEARQERVLEVVYGRLQLTTTGAGERPIGVPVEVIRTGGQTTIAADVSGNDNGRFVVDAPPGRYTLKAGRLVAWSQTVDLKLEQREEMVARFGEIKVQATEVGSAPVGARVVLADAATGLDLGTTSTSPDSGLCHFILPAGAYRLTVGDVAAQRIDVQLETSQQRVVPVSFGRIAVEVRGADDVALDRKVELILSGSRQLAGQAWTDSQLGRCSFIVSPGSYLARVDNLATREFPTMVAGGTESFIRAQAGRLTVSGRGVNGKPISVPLAIVSATDESEITNVRTSEQSGETSFDLWPGHYTVRVGRQVPMTATALVSAAEDTAVVFTYGALKVVFNDESRVSVMAEDRETEIAAGGVSPGREFDIDLAPGNYWCRIVEGMDEPELLTIKPNEITVLQKAIGHPTLTVAALDVLSRPVPNTLITVMTPDGRQDLESLFTGVGGQAAFTMRDGSYTLRAEINATRIVQPARVVLPSEDPVDPFLFSVLQLRIRDHDRSGRSIPVSIRDQHDSQRLGSYRTDDSGYLELVMAPGRYLLQVDIPGSIRHLQTIDLTTAEPAVVELELGLAAIEARAPQELVELPVVMLQDTDGRDLIDMSTDRRGRVNWSLPAGDYRCLLKIGTGQLDAVLTISAFDTSTVRFELSAVDVSAIGPDQASASIPFTLKRNTHEVVHHDQVSVGQTRRVLLVPGMYTCEFNTILGTRSPAFVVKPLETGQARIELGRLRVVSNLRSQTTLEQSGTWGKPVAIGLVDLGTELSVDLPPGNFRVRLVHLDHSFDPVDVMVGETVELTFFRNRDPIIDEVRVDPFNLPPNATAGVSVRAHDPDGDPLRFTYRAGQGRIVGEGSEVTYRSPPTPGPYEIMVSVEDGRGGVDSTLVHLSGCEILVQAWGPDRRPVQLDVLAMGEATGKPVARTATGVGGVARLSVPEGRYTIVGDHSGAMASSGVTAQRGVSAEVEFRHGAIKLTAPHQDIEFQRLRYRLIGADGLELGTGDLRQADLPHDLTVPPGTYSLFIDIDSARRVFSDIRVKELEVVEVSMPIGRLELEFTAASGDPLEGHCAIWSRDGIPGADGRSLSRGRCRFVLFEGDYRFECTMNSMTSGLRSVKVRAGEVVSDSLVSGAVAVNLIGRTESAGRAAVEIRRMYDTTVLATTRVSDLGAAMIPAWSGSYDIECRSDSYRLHRDGVKVANGKITHCNLELAQIVVSLHGPGQQPLAGDIEIISLENGSEVYTSSIGSGGSRTVNLGVGRFLVTVKRHGMLLRETVELGPGESEALHFVCGGLNISVKGSSGRALPADVDLLRSGDRTHVTSGRTDSDGLLSFVVPPGDYLVVAKHKRTSVSRDAIPCFSGLTTLVPLWQFGALRAHSVGKSGVPLRSEVTVFDQITGQIIESAHCNENGEAVFDLSSGIYMTRTKETNEIVHRGVRIVSGHEQIFNVMSSGDVIGNSPPGIADLLVYPIDRGPLRGVYAVLLTASDPDGDRISIRLDAPQGWLWRLGSRRFYLPRDPAETHLMTISVKDRAHEPVAYELVLPVDPLLTGSLATRLRWYAGMAFLLFLGVAIVGARLWRKRRAHG